ncbi:MAG: prephenate dehydratase domain-containing protein, partial [Bacteroidota bacterium]
KIIHEIILPIDFTFIAKQKRLEEVNSLYVQFKTHNQCLNFIEHLGEIDIVTTPSNGASYSAYMEDGSCDAVIIPSHSIDAQTMYNYRTDHVADSTDNETRFVILSTHLNQEEQEWTPWRTSFVVSNDKDRPGLLSDILNVFSVRGINLLSIISRPKKNGLGNYNFFIDIEGCYQKSSIVKEAVQVIMKDYDIKILGSYYKVQHEYHTKLSRGFII